MTGSPWLFFVGAYLVGAIPFSYLIARWRSGIDIRHLYDGNVGAHNAARAAGLPFGFLAAFLDGLKGFSVGVVAQGLYGPQSGVVWFAGLCVLLGHQFPIYLRFRGGKGISTLYGFFFALYPGLTTFFLAVVVLAFAITRNFDLSLAIAMIIFPFAGLRVVGSTANWLRLVGLMAVIGLKKLIDLPYERMTLQQHHEKGNDVT